MTPKQKAKELVEKTFCFYLGDDGKGNEFYTDKLECLRAADKCANEVIKALDTRKSDYMYLKQVEYWKEVKQELEKLL
jgi:hypothetical protein